MKSTRHNNRLMAVTIASLGLIATGTAIADEIAIGGVNLNGTIYESVTICASTPLRIVASDGTAATTSLAGECAQGISTQSTPHVGRNGTLTPREFEMAKTAWSYFETFYQPDTGLVNAVGNFPSTTLWDTASYISALVAAYELCVIDKREFDRRATQLLDTLRNLPLYRGEAPNKVYNAATGAMVDYANEPGEIGMSANDIGRLLVWLQILKQRNPHLANSVDNVPMRWDFCNLINDDGRMFGSFT